MTTASTADNSTPELDLERLVLIAGGHTAFHLLWAGVELGLYDLLSRQPKLSSSEVAQALSLKAQPTRILLTGLTALRILVKSDNTYRNAAITEQVLVSSKPGSAAPILGWQRYIVYEGLLDFVESLRQDRNVGLRRFPGVGQTLYERLQNDPFKEGKFQEAMSALSLQANQHLLRFTELSQYRHLVDAGGGDGTNALALARKFPQLKLTVFDSESVCAMASTNIRQQGLTQQVDTWVGDFFKDAFPPGIDAILYAHILTIWAPQTNVELLTRTHAALPPGGSVIVFNMMGADDDSGPLSTALGSPYFQAVATGAGMLYSWSDYESWMRTAGFSKIQRFDQLPLNHGILVGTK